MNIPHQIAVHNLSMGASVEDAAAEVGVQPATLIRWLDDAAFQLEVERAEAALKPTRKPMQRAQSSLGDMPRGRARAAAC